MLTSLSCPTSKASIIDMPLVVALIITSVIHLLIILTVEIDLPEIKENYRRIAITIIKAPPKKTTFLAPAQPTPTVVKPISQITAVAKTPVPIQKRRTNLIAKNYPKKISRAYHPMIKKVGSHVDKPIQPIAEKVVITKPKVETIPVAPVEPASVVEPKKIVVPETIEKTKAVVVEPPIEAVAPVAPIKPVPVVEPEKVIVPEPIVEPKVVVESPVDAVEPIPTKAIAVEKAVPQPELSTSEPIDKPVEKPADMPIKTSTKSAKKAKKIPKPVEKIESTQSPPLSMEDLAAQIAQVGEKYGNQSLETPSETPHAKKSPAKHNHKALANQYRADCRHKVERIGSFNYPKAALQKDLTDRSVIEAVIKADGSIEQIRIRKSSGDAEIDAAAKNIVQMSAPFAAFPNVLAEDMDEITVSFSLRFSDESGVTVR